MLAVPSLKPKRLRGVDCDGRRGGGAAEAELRPAHRDRAEADPGQVADRVHGDLRVVRAGLDAEVAVRLLRVEHVGREVRQRAQRLRLPVGEAEAVLAVLVAEERRTEAEGDRQPARVAARSPRRCRPAAGWSAPRSAPISPADRPARHPVGRLGPGRQQRDQLGPRAGGDVERREVQPVLGRRGDAGLVLAAERVGVARVGARLAVGGGRPAGGERAGGQAGGGDTAADQTAARDPGQDSTAAGELRERLGERVDGVRESLDLVRR